MVTLAGSSPTEFEWDLNRSIFRLEVEILGAVLGVHVGTTESKVGARVDNGAGEVEDGGSYKNK